MYILCTVYINRQRIESLILSSQISTDPQRREFQNGDAVQITFNIAMVWTDSNIKSMCTYWQIQGHYLFTIYPQIQGHYLKCIVNCVVAQLFQLIIIYLAQVTYNQVQPFQINYLINQFLQELEPSIRGKIILNSSLHEQCPAQRLQLQLSD